MATMRRTGSCAVTPPTVATLYQLQQRLYGQSPIAPRIVEQIVLPVARTGAVPQHPAGAVRLEAERVTVADAGRAAVDQQVPGQPVHPLQAAVVVGGGDLD